MTFRNFHGLDLTKYAVKLLLAEYWGHRYWLASQNIRSDVKFQGFLECFFFTLSLEIYLCCIKIALIAPLSQSLLGQ